MENKQKELTKKSRKKMKSYNSYASPTFLAKKASKSSLPKALSVEEINDAFVSKGDKYTISVPLTSIDNIVLKEKLPKASKKGKSKKSTYNFMLSLPNKDSNTFSGYAKVSKDNSIVYKDYQENTDVVVQALEEGSLRILTILNDADAPTEYIYKVNLPIGGHMKKLPDGSIVILDKNKKFTGAFTPAWALDKNGEKVPTHYEIRGNKLIQVVEHLSLNVAYPVVADPYYGRRMIRSAYWKKRPQKHGDTWFHYQITVIPSSFGLSLQRFYYAKEGWLQLRRKIQNNQWLNYNTASMQAQYYCHINFAWFRDEYHLEHWRPHTTWKKMMAYGCNPPGYM